MNRKKIYEEVEEMLSFCEGCFVQKHFRKENGRTFAHQFCLSQCTVGEKLKKLGQELTNLNEK
ncbi:zinc-finger domain-containing protein [Peribacillus asahii]|uniref:zinc-finger domain-containing protein n=1 Tax=Peribacillus asahii TaxID=228899 RepID=UPI00207B0B9C|nr:zinc-finger domain-containing protein [Peribacillus asahii]USK58562.1 zinc-finger domain-containing protein [Peribacillus asahii]